MVLPQIKDICTNFMLFVAVGAISSCDMRKIPKNEVQEKNISDSYKNQTTSGPPKALPEEIVTLERHANSGNKSAIFDLYLIYSMEGREEDSVRWYNRGLNANQIDILLIEAGRYRSMSKRSGLREYLDKAKNLYEAAYAECRRIKRKNCEEIREN